MKIKKVINSIINIMTVFVFIILILTIFSRINMVITNKNYFSLFGYSFFEITTGSMEPTLNENDIVIVDTKSTYNTNDIITYESDNNFITHRLISMSGTNLVTKGDANNTSDTNVKTTDVVGKVVKILPGLGVWQKVFTNPQVILSLFITLLLFDFAFSYKGKKQAVTDTNIVVNKIEPDTKDNTDIKTDDIDTKEISKKIDNIDDNYTIRLDLEELKKRIDSEMSKDDK